MIFGRRFGSIFGPWALLLAPGVPFLERPEKGAQKRRSGSPDHRIHSPILVHFGIHFGAFFGRFFGSENRPLFGPPWAGFWSKKGSILGTFLVLKWSKMGVRNAAVSSGRLGTEKGSGWDPLPLEGVKTVGVL